VRKLRYTLRGARGKQEAGEVSWSPISKTRDRGAPDLLWMAGRGPPAEAELTAVDYFAPPLARFPAIVVPAVGNSVEARV